MQLKVKKLVPEATIPSYANPGDNGLDMVATSILFEERYIEYKTGISVKISEGFVGLLFQRSSVTKQVEGFNLKNAVGVIDATYTGEITLRYTYPFNFTSERDQIYKVGDKVGQLVIVTAPTVQTIEVDELPSTVRGDKGYGSTGK